MSSKQSPKAERIARALGADRVVSLDRLHSQAPLDLFERKNEVQHRLRSTGGRKMMAETFSERLELAASRRINLAAERAHATAL